MSDQQGERRAFIGVFALSAVAGGLARATLAVFAPEVQADLDISDASYLTLVSLAGTASVAAGPLVAPLVSRLSRRLLLAGGGLLSALALLAIGLSSTGLQLAMAQIGLGLGRSVDDPTLPTLVKERFGQVERLRVFALVYLGQPLGLAIGPVAAGALVSFGPAQDWRQTMMVLAFVALAVSVAIAVAPGIERKRRPEGLQLAAEPTVVIRFSPALSRLRSISPYHWFALSIGAVSPAIVVVPSELGLLLEHTYQLDAPRRAVLLGLCWVPAVVFISLATPVLERLGWGQRSARPMITVMVLLVAAYGLIATAGLATANLVGLLVGVAVGNGFLAVAMSLNALVLVDIVPHRLLPHAFAALGVYVMSTGGLPGSVLTGSLSDAFGERRSLLVVIPLSAALAVTALLAARSSLRPHDDGDGIRHGGRRPSEPSRGGTATLVVEDLAVSIDGRAILHGVDLSVDSGEMVALLGTNGSGKTTLVKAIGGLLPSDRGLIALGSTDLTFADAAGRARNRLWVVVGGDGLVPGLSVDDHWALWSATNSQTIDPAVEKFFPELLRYRRFRAETLSGGMGHLLAISRLFVGEPPRVAVVDEATLGLYPEAAERLAEALDSLRSSGAAVLIVDQQLGPSTMSADRVLFMDDGIVRYRGSAMDLIDRTDLLRPVMLGGRDGPDRPEDRNR